MVHKKLIGVWNNLLHEYTVTGWEFLQNDLLNLAVRSNPSAYRIIPYINEINAYLSEKSDSALKKSPAAGLAIGFLNNEIEQITIDSIYFALPRPLRSLCIIYLQKIGTKVMVEYLISSNTQEIKNMLHSFNKFLES